MELKIWVKRNPKVFFVHDTFMAEAILELPYYTERDCAEEKGRQFFNIGDSPKLGVIIM